MRMQSALFAWSCINHRLCRRLWPTIKRKRRQNTAKRAWTNKWRADKDKGQAEMVRDSDTITNANKKRQTESDRQIRPNATAQQKRTALTSDRKCTRSNEPRWPTTWGTIRKRRPRWIGSHLQRTIKISAKESRSIENGLNGVNIRTSRVTKVNHACVSWRRTTITTKARDNTNNMEIGIGHVQQTKEMTRQHC